MFIAYACKGTTLPKQNTRVPTIIDTAVKENLIASPTVGIYFQPSQSDNDVNGAMTLGYVDDLQLTGDLVSG